MKKALIVFPDEWLAFSPTVLNINTYLTEIGYQVKIIAFNNMHFQDQNYKLKNINVKYIDINTDIYKKLRITRIIKLIKLMCDLFLNRSKYDFVLSVDSISFLACKIFFYNPIYLSLEIKKDIFFNISLLLGINHMIIQSIDRKKYLVPNNESIEISILPNSPLYYKTKLNINRKKNLIYFGNIIPAHGVEECIKALLYVDKDYNLTLKGVITKNYKKALEKKYNHLINVQRLIIDCEYVDQNQVVEYLSNYYIGFCIYNFNFIKENKFNYVSSPSGKMFNYYAAGIPIIGINIVGLKSIKDYNAGVLLDEITPRHIANAIININDDYLFYGNNCLKAAKDFSFRVAFNQIIKLGFNV